MKIHCIADEDTVRGFRLAGATGDIVNTASQAAAAIQAAVMQSEYAVIIVTENIAELVRPTLDQIRFEREHPLVVEIPGPTGTTRERKNLRQLVQEAVGISLEPDKGG